MPATGYEQLTCARCSYTWIPRKEELPARCPNCRSIKWNATDIGKTCLRCGRSWNSHDGNPQRCPNCGSAKWNVPPEFSSCRVCGNRWIPRGGKQPARCPKCGSRQWNVENPGWPTPEEKRLREETEATILEAYRRGEGCVSISIDAGISYATVREIVLRNNPATRLNI